jgi:hypothetical protein
MDDTKQQQYGCGSGKCALSMMRTLEEARADWEKTSRYLRAIDSMTRPRPSHLQVAANEAAAAYKA